MEELEQEIYKYKEFVGSVLKWLVPLGIFVFILSIGHLYFSLSKEGRKEFLENMKDKVLAVLIVLGFLGIIMRIFG